MSKKINQEELNAILHAITLFPQGATLEEIMHALKHSIPKRTLQRRVSLLINLKQLKAIGGSRSRKYVVQYEPFAKTKAQKESFISLSPQAKIIQNHVEQPVQMRQYVGYKRKFLDAYHPNSTYYLSEAIRKQLWEMGKSPDGERPAATFARQILNRLLIDLSWNSSRLEGNTYSILETERLIELGQFSEGKDIKETQMILNHKAAIEFLVESIDDVGINRYTILNLHALLSYNLLANPKACGRLRTIPVGIAKTVYHPLAVPQLIDECFQQILDTGRAITDPFEQAFFLMLHLPYLQPFEDVNKQVSRLASNIPLIQKNLCPLSFVDVPESVYISGLLGVYELNRFELLLDVFIWAYKRSCALYLTTRQTLGEPDPFRMHYRELIQQTVREVVCGCINKKMADVTIKKRAREKVPADDQIRFIEVVETEVLSLHEGNIARYRLRPSEYHSWKSSWF